ncbi:MULTISPECIES: DUF1236 domain-containing protein [unclassified Bradyrhizobium]|uniref:DUF1236 domain-containing protein n=1 Tax=unclassified Bradyrhizobium TaxID=2631580 RepID=UPI0024B07FB6|nr:DUF1236 domain-containing protein [Bradyrhizobium sp. CB2312]WFU68855.1 DUF1236 domain-containing protein [Bradyrhizobium sp. CB2312]
MLNRFMISVATLALVAGTGLANAQDKGRDAGGAGSQQQMQHSQPSGGAAERGSMGKESTHEKGTVGQAGGAMKQGGAEEKSGAMEKSGTAEKSGGMDKSGAMNKNAADEKAGAKGEHAQGAQDKAAQDKSKSMSSESSTTKSDSTKSGTKDMKAEDNKAGGAAKSNNAESRPAATDKSQTTTGAASATATAAPPPEKRTEISTAIKSTKIEETTNVNFNISVGAAVPASVRFHPLPPRIVEIYPEWRGYEVIFVHGQYVIVRPQTREIVYIIEG